MFLTLRCCLLGSAQGSSLFKGAHAIVMELCEVIMLVIVQYTKNKNEKSSKSEETQDEMQTYTANKKNKCHNALQHYNVSQ